MPFARSYEKLYECALSIMQAHVPEGARKIIDSVMMSQKEGPSAVADGIFLLWLHAEIKRVK